MSNVHFDAFANVNHAVATVRTLVGAPSNDTDMLFQAPTARGKADMLASMDVLTPENWAAYAALMAVTS